MREPAHQHFIRVGLHDIDYRINYLEANRTLSQGTLKVQNTRIGALISFSEVPYIRRVCRLLLARVLTLRSTGTEIENSRKDVCSQRSASDVYSLYKISKLTSAAQSRTKENK